jgi:outer membrane cobalamin receptor
MDGETRRRNHSEVESRKYEGNVTGTLANGAQIAFKAYYYDSDRDIPGATISYNPYSGERTSERTTFAQASFRQSHGGRWQWMANMKYSFAEMHYNHLLYPSTASRYYQREGYLNLTALYRVLENFSFSWANDGTIGSFRSIHEGQGQDISPKRTGWLSALSGKYEADRMTLNLSAVLQTTIEAGAARQSEIEKQHLSPSVSASVQPFERWPLRVRAFYRNTYRWPTFADIYYPTFPNLDLKPENARQYNIGGIVTTAIGEAFPYLSFSVDAYYNRVENKIMAIPLSSLALWSVRNYGTAHIRGIDLNLVAHLRLPNEGWTAEASGNYTLQEVLNDKKQAFRYTPRHYATALATLGTPWVDLHYHLIYCGKRYYNETPSRESLVESYADHGFSVAKNFCYKDCMLHLSAECINVTNQQYEVVHGYPMPGRSFRLGIKFTY